MPEIIFVDWNGNRGINPEDIAISLAMTEEETDEEEEDDDL